MNATRPTLRHTVTAALAVVLAGGLTACASGAHGDEAPASKGGVTSVGVATLAGPAFTPVTIKVARDEAIRKQLPKAILDSGRLTIGVGALPSVFPPLVTTGTDQRTLTGSEPDLGRLLAAVLGLKPAINNSTWENLFIGITGGRSDVGLSNITDTEERKQKYDFATYRHDDLAFETPVNSTLSFTGDPSVLAGRTISVGSGTNQERILLAWQKELAAKGENFDVKYFPDQNSVNLALASGRIDAYFGPNPGIQYHIAQGKSGPSPTKAAGRYSGAGATLQGLIGATTKKGNGLVAPLQLAINKLIATGAYAKWLRAYHLSNEAVPTSQINPTGLPLSDS